MKRIPATKIRKLTAREAKVCWKVSTLLKISVCLRIEHKDPCEASRHSHPTLDQDRNDQDRDDVESEGNPETGPEILGF